VTFYISALEILLLTYLLTCSWQHLSASPKIFCDAKCLIPPRFRRPCLCLPLHAYVSHVLCEIFCQ